MKCCPSQFDVSFIFQIKGKQQVDVDGTLLLFYHVTLRIALNAFRRLSNFAAAKIHRGRGLITPSPITPSGTRAHHSLLHHLSPITYHPSLDRGRGPSRVAGLGGRKGGATNNRNLWHLLQTRSHPSSFEMATFSCAHMLQIVYCQVFPAMFLSFSPLTHWQEYSKFEMSPSKFK